MNSTESNRPTLHSAALVVVLTIADLRRDYHLSRTLQWQLRKSGALPYRQAEGSSKVYYTDQDIATYFSSIRRGGKKAA